MESIRQIFQEIDSALREDPSQAEGVNAVYEFHFHDEESLTYQLVLKEDEKYASEGSKEDADCTLTMLKEDFKKMVEGELNGTKAFMSGRLKIQGNMGLALKLQNLLSSYKAVN